MNNKGLPKIYGHVFEKGGSYFVSGLGTTPLRYESAIFTFKITTLLTVLRYKIDRAIMSNNRVVTEVDGYGFESQVSIA